jgi:hypothetical protein
MRDKVEFRLLGGRLPFQRMSQQQQRERLAVGRANAPEYEAIFAGRWAFDLCVQVLIFVTGDGELPWVQPEEPAQMCACARMFSKAEK